MKASTDKKRRQTRHEAREGLELALWLALGLFAGVGTAVLILTLKLVRL